VIKGGIHGQLCLNVDKNSTNDFLSTKAQQTDTATFTGVNISREHLFTVNMNYIVKLMVYKNPGI